MRRIFLQIQSGFLHLLQVLFWKYNPGKQQIHLAKVFYRKKDKTVAKRNRITM